MRTFSLDMIPGGNQTAVACNQYEAGDTWVFALYYDGGRYSIPADAEVSITGTKPDGAAYNIAGTVVDNAVVIEVTEQMTACAGRSIAEILVESETDGTTLYSANFPLLVEPAAVQGDLSPSEIPAAIVDADGNVYVSGGSLTLGIDGDDGLLYIYVNGIKQGEGVDIGGGATRYTITYNLAANMVSSNTATKITESRPYTSTISSSNVDYQIDDITVTMGGTDITSSVVENNVITIPSVTADVTITVTAVYYPAVQTDYPTLTIASAGTGTLGVKLHAQPTQSQTVSLFSDDLTLSVNTLTFTTSNWDTYQYVTVTAPSVDDATYAYINLINSDPLMTESTVMVTVKELGYEDLVDTTIPTEGMHTVTLDDFTSSQTWNGTHIRLYGYNGEYTNIKVPATIDGYTTWITCTSSSSAASSNSFASNTDIQYVTFEDGVVMRPGAQTSGMSAEGLFSGCSALIGVKGIPTGVTSLSGAFKGCTNLKFVDGLDTLVNLTSLSQAFYQSGIEYVQDLSGITGCGLYRTFRECASLKKIFGLPQPATAQSFEYSFMGTQVEKVTFPENTSSLTYAFLNNTHVNHVEILADGLATSNLTSIFGSSQTQNIDVYANPNSTTLASLQSMFASSTKVSVHEIGNSVTLPSIVVWGDSTSSPNRPWIEWPARLQTKLGTSEYLVKNQAVSGECTTSTSARQGGNAMHTNAFEIPADTTAALVTLTTADGQTFSGAPIFNAGGAFNPCTISGVGGAISKSGANYYFTRSESGTAVSVPSGTTVTSDNDTVFNASGNVMLVNIGTNSGWNSNAATLINQMQLMVDHFIALGGTAYIITGPWSGTWVSTDGGWEVTQEVASLASQAFGSHWLDLPADMAANCQTDNPSVSWTAEDLAYIAAGKTPLPSLTSDNVHPTEAGANSQMMAYYRKGVALGYWS